MKRVWIVSGIVVLIIATGLMALWHLSTVTKELEASLVSLSQSVTDENPQLEKLAEEFENLWKKHETVMIRYIHHDDLNEITGTVARLRALARYKSFSEMAAEIDLLRRLIQQIYESDIPTLKSIM